SLMFLSLLAVLFGARPETVPLLLRVPWPVAASFLALSGAIAASRPERSIVGIIFSPAAGGRTLRRRLPLGIAVVVAVGYVRVAGERLGWYDTSFGAALMVCAAVSYLWFVVLSGARAFERADRERRQAHDQAVREHARIEAMAAELRHAVEARDRSLMQLEAIIGNMREGLVVVDPHATVLTMNPAALSIFGYGSIEETRQSFTEFAETARVCDAAGEPLAFSQWPIVRVVRGETFTGSEVEMLRADGATFVGSFSGAPVRDKAGVLIFGIITVRDVTEQKRAEQALRAAIETRDNFLSIASHELKTPLTSLKLQTALGKRALRKGEPSFCAPERLGKHLEDTDRQVDRLSRLVEDMLDVSRIEAGKLCLTYEAVDLRGLVRDVAERLRPDLTSGAYDLAIDASGPVVGHWDHYRIEQVVVNLLTNAMKYGAGKPIRVSVLREGEVARLVVRDQGIGIPRDKHEAIFGRFERAVSRNEVSGLGLGLYIVRHIVQQHQGLVYVESEPARGATFTVELPLETVASA
ncbi:MAG TPA: PAS domain-containing sensor histidine kinase, partial [Myxococcota bacterium]|nr:PAS domain-containing sensor histidine kinase [Myxococcota bacterium]